MGYNALAVVQFATVLVRRRSVSHTTFRHQAFYLCGAETFPQSIIATNGIRPAIQHPFLRRRILTFPRCFLPTKRIQSWQYLVDRFLRVWTNKTRHPIRQSTASKYFVRKKSIILHDTPLPWTRPNLTMGCNLAILRLTNMTDTLFEQLTDNQKKHNIKIIAKS